MLILQVRYVLADDGFKAVLFETDNGRTVDSFGPFELAKDLLEVALSRYPKAKVVYR